MKFTLAITVRASLSNFSIRLNIFLLLLSCCKCLDFTSYIQATAHKNFKLPPTVGPGAAAPPPLMRHCSCCTKDTD